MRVKALVRRSTRLASLMLAVLMLWADVSLLAQNVYAKGETGLQETADSLQEALLQEKGSVLAGKTISILGASISTYAGTSNGDAADYTNSTIWNNAKYYPHAVVSDVTLYDTWWMQAVADLGLRLLVNNSWSGSALLHERNGTAGAYVDRCVQLHDNTGENAGEVPDIIGIQMGTNDFQYYKETLGTADIDYDALIHQNDDGTYTYAMPKTSLEAAAIVLHKISVRYPKAEVYYLNVSQRVDGTDTLIRTFNADLKQVVEHFGAHIVDIYGSAITMADFDTYIGDGKAHPNKLGMDAYTEAFKRAVIENTAYEVDTHLISFDLEGVKADYGDDKLVVSGDSFSVHLSSDIGVPLSVKVTMNGEDITSKAYENGTVTIESVIGDVMISANQQHTPTHYRFAFDGTDLTCVSGENELTKIYGTTEDGVFHQTCYALEKSVVLMHDRPWIVEWRSEGTFMNTDGSTGARIFSSTKVNAEYQARSIFKSAKYGLISMGEKTKSGSHNYGIALEDYGIDYAAPHTYRLENRIAEDGSNMVWIYVDGNEIGALNHYYIGTVNQNQISDWIAGKNFVFPYMGTDTHGFSNCSIEYIAVWENGKDHTHLYTTTTTPFTCTSQGFTTHTCACGESYVGDYVEATGHAFEGGICTVCGEAAPDYSEPVWGTWIAFGTSITEDNDYMRPNATNIKGTYIPYLSELMGVDAPDANYSIGGAAFSTHLLMYIYHEKYQKTGLTYNGYTHTAIKNADLITIEGGVNDFYGNVPLGKVGDTVPYSKADPISVNPNSTNNFGGTTDGTFAGCIYAAITELRRVAPDATIVFITDNAGTGSCAATKANALGHYLHDYNDIMITVAENMGCYVIDAGRTAGFEENLETYLSDHIHHSEVGGEAYANAIWKGLCAIQNGEKPESGHTHRYIESVTAPTCTTQGFTTHTCVCGHSYVDSYVAAKGHSFGAWTQVKAPTCGAEGQDMRTCAVCGAENYRDTRISGDANQILVSDPLPSDYFAGKKIVTLGDSVTFGSFLDNRLTEAYPYVLGELLGATISNRAVSGSSICTGGHVTVNESLTEDKIKGADVVTIMLGINDFNHAVKNGIWQGKLKYDENASYYGLGNYDSTDTSEFYGALRAWCEKIAALKQTEQFKDTQFVFITPPVSGRNRSVEQQNNWDQRKENIYGHTLRQYCTAVMEVCAEYGIPVFDANMFSGIYYNSPEDTNVYETGGDDGVHPSAAGHALIAKSLAEFLLENYAYEQRAVSDGGHSYDAVVTDPTCTKQGYTTYTCPVCVYSYVGSCVPALGHQMSEWSQTKAPTCTEAGSERRDCARCDHFETRDIAAKGHSHKSVVTAPTCTAQGYTTHTCACGDSYVDNYTDELGQLFATADLLTSGERLVLAERNITIINKVMILSCDTKDLGTGIIRLGHGKTAYSGSYVEITATQLLCYSVGTTVSKVWAVDHGLDLQEGLHVRIEKGSGNRATVTLKNPTGKCSITPVWSGQNGDLFCEVEGGMLSDVDLRWYCDDYDADIWLFGDSWFSNYSDARWTTYLLKYGHSDILLAAYGGMGAEVGAEQFKEFLKIDKPKYAVWCMGMNNGDKNGDINSSWLSSTQEFLRLCEENGVIPVLATIPTTPKVDNRLKNEWVVKSGYRYIDFDLAVVENHITGEWFEGMAASDLNHPTVLGAQTLYCQAINDCPILAVGALNSCMHVLEKMEARSPECVYGGRKNYYICLLCAETFADVQGTVIIDSKTMLLAPYGHSYTEWSQTKAPTCTESGSERRDCAHCDHFETRDIAAKGHSHKAVVTPPTCTAQGYTTHTCACGDSYVDSYVNATGAHTYENGNCAVCGVAVWDKDGDGVLRILAVGNSHTANYTEFVPNICTDMYADGFGTKIVLTRATVSSIGLYSGRNSNPNAVYRSHLAALADKAGVYSYLSSKQYDLIIVQDYMESIVDEPAVFAAGLASVIRAMKDIIADNGFVEPEFAWFADWVDVRSCGGDTALRDGDGNKISLPKLSREEAYQKSLAAIAEVESRIGTDAADMPKFVIHGSTIKQNAMSSYLGTSKLWENTKYCLLESDTTHLTNELGKYLVGAGALAEIVNHYRDSLALGENGTDIGSMLTIQNAPNVSGTGSQYEGAVNADILAIVREAIGSASQFKQSVYTVDPVDAFVERVLAIAWNTDAFADEATALASIREQIAAVDTDCLDSYSVAFKQFDSIHQMTVVLHIMHGYTVKEVEWTIHRCVYAATVTLPTCTTQGYTTHTCVCGDSYVDSYVPAKGHSYENGICTACGEKDPTYIAYGDLDGDGVINTTDVVLLRRYIAGGYGVEISEKAADLNGDGILNTTDVVLLRRYIAGGYDIVLPGAV